ncbi:MAG: type IV pilus assembly protein PilM [bacterium]|nr:type IV pilus assembly protein PilM [bacterium]
MRLEDSVLSVFPPPSFVAMPAAGIDISQGSVKCVVLRQRGMVSELASYLEIPVPEGAIVNGDIEVPERIVEILRSIRLRLGVHYANASLSERKSYLYQAIVPGRAKDLRSAVESDLEAHVPLPPGEVLFDFEPIRETGEGTAVSVTAYARRIVEGYMRMFKSAGIMLRMLEAESQSLVRATLSEADASAPVMIVDFGKHTTRIAIAENGVVAFTATLDVGGDSLTAAVMKLFSVPEPEAEKIKNERGFLMNKENKDLIEALMTTVSVVKDEVAKHLSYWNNPAADDPPRKNVEKIIVCGGNANLRGFPEYLEGAVGLPVSVANVWVRAFSLDAYVPPMPFSESLEYATAIGLAERGSPNMPW